MKRILGFGLAVMLVLSSIFTVGAENLQSAATGASSAVFRDDFDSIKDEQITSSDKSLVTAKDGILTLGTSESGNGSYTLTDFKTPLGSFSIAFRFKYSGGAGGLGIEATTNANHRIRCQIYPNNTCVNYFGGSMTGISHSENTWYNYIIDVVPTANSALKLTYYRKTDSQTDYQKLGEATKSDAGGSGEKIKLESYGSVADFDYISVTSDKYAEDDIVSATKNVIYENDFSDETDGVKVIGADGFQVNNFKPSGAWNVKVRFQYMGGGEPTFLVHDGTKRMKLSVNATLLMYHTTAGSVTINLPHSVGTWYEYLVAVDANGYANYYRKTDDETEYTKILSNELLTTGGTSNAIVISGNTTKVDYISVFSQAYSEDEILGTDRNILFETDENDYPGGIVLTSGQENILKSDFYRVGDYALHFKYKMGTDGATFEVNGGQRRVKAGIYPAALGYDVVSGTYQSTAITHENGKYYEYIADYSQSDNIITYYRKADGETNYTKIATAVYTSAFTGGKLNTIKVSGTGTVDFVSVTSKKHTAAELLDGANITSLYEKNATVSGGTPLTAAVGDVRYPYVINIKFTMNDQRGAMEYVDASGYRTKLEVYPDGFLTNIGTKFTTANVPSGTQLEYMIKVDSNKIPQIYQNLGNGVYDKVYTDSVVGGRTPGLAVRTNDGTTPLNVEYVRVYSAGDECISVKSKGCTIENGTAAGSADIYFNSADSAKTAPAVVILAVYGADGSLKRVSATDAVIGGNVGAVKTAAQSITGDFVEGDAAEIFVWDSLSTMRPY